MSYIGQADWFFKTGAEQNSVQPQQASPATTQQNPETAAPPPQNASIQKSPQSKPAEPTPAPPPVIEKKKESSWIYWVGGIGLLAGLGWLYFKTRFSKGGREPLRIKRSEPETLDVEDF